MGLFALYAPWIPDLLMGTTPHTFKMDPSFMGNWQVDQSKTNGVEAFGKAMGFSEEKIENYKKLDYQVTLSESGDTYTVNIDFKGLVPNKSYSLKLGETIDYTSMDGYTAKLTLTFADGAATESYVYGEKDIKWSVTRTVSGDVMTAVTNLGEATLTQQLNRV